MKTIQHGSSRPWRRERSEIIQGLGEQAQALKQSGSSYNNGNIWEAKRIAAAVDILVHSRGKHTISIMDQLGCLRTTSFLSTASPIDPRNVLAQMPLVIHQVGPDGFQHIPMFTQKPPLMHQNWIKFSEWWEQPVLAANPTRILSRKNLTISLRDQDSGSHYDARLTDETYADFARRNGSGMIITQAGKSAPPSFGPELPTMRQIGWEVETTLDAVMQTLS